MRMTTFLGSITAMIMTLVAVTVPTIGLAQPKGYGIGDNVGDFRLKNVDDRAVTLTDYRTSKGLIVVFMSNHCPFAKAYEDRLIALDRKYAPQGFPVLAIQPNDPTAYEEESFANMKARAREKGYPFPYLLDDTQATAHAFGALRTPQVFVLKHTGDRFTVEYTGTIDDNPQDPTGVRTRYVEDAVNNLLQGRPVVTTTTRAIGCAIKWKGI